MTNQRKECGSGGDRKYIGLVYAIKFCDFYNRRAMSCTAKSGTCGRQHQRPEAVSHDHEGR